MYYSLDVVEVKLKPQKEHCPIYSTWS